MEAIETYNKIGKRTLILGGTFLTLLLHVLLFLLTQLNFFTYIFVFATGAITAILGLSTVAFCIYYEYFGLFFQKDLKQIIEESQLESDNQYPPTKERMVGWASIQFMGKSKETKKGIMVLDRSIVLWKPVDGKPESVVRFNISGAKVLKTSLVSFPNKYIIEIYHPDRKILPSCDYLYIILSSELDYERWIHAIKNASQSENPLIISNKEREVIRKYFMDNPPSQVENSIWLNAIALIFYLHIRKSTKIKERVLHHLAKKFAMGIEKKGYSNILSDVVITEIDLGSHAPSISSIKLQKIGPDTEIKMEFDVKYLSGDARLGISSIVKLGFANVKAKFKVVLSNLKGRMILVIPPYPAKRFYVSFLEEPITELSVEVTLGNREKANYLPVKIQTFIIKRLKRSISERFVHPNRFFFPIPGAVTEEDNTASESKFQVDIAEALRLMNLQIKNDLEEAKQHSQQSLIKQQSLQSLTKQQSQQTLIKQQSQQSLSHTT